jgi:hypothetical protein
VGFLDGLGPGVETGAQLVPLAGGVGGGPGLYAAVENPEGGGVLVLKLADPRKLSDRRPGHHTVAVPRRHETSQ